MRGSIRMVGRFSIFKRMFNSRVVVILFVREFLCNIIEFFNLYLRSLLKTLRIVVLYIFFVII